MRVVMSSSSSISATVAPSDAAARRRARAERPPRRRSGLVWLWITFAVLAIGGLTYAGLQMWDRLRPVVELRIQDASGALLPAVRVELFAVEPDGAAVCPPKRLGVCEVEAGILDVPPEWIEGQAVLARVSADGFGQSFIRLRDREAVALRLEKPRPFAIQLLESNGAPASDAEVELVGGEARGVVLASLTSDEQGWVRCDSISAFHRSIHVRAYLPGHELLSRDVQLVRNVEPIRLRATEPVQGQVEAPMDFPGGYVAGLRVQVFNVFGPHAVIGEQGRFRLDYQPAPPQLLRMIIPDLPEGWTHRRVLADEDRRVHIQINRAVRVSGRVVDSLGRGIGRAVVQQDHGPRGRESVTCDGSGGFVLTRVPPGAVRLRASHWQQRGTNKGAFMLSGYLDLGDLQPGETRQGQWIEVK